MPEEIGAFYRQRMTPHMGTFIEAQRWVSHICEEGQFPFELEAQGEFYVVRKWGQVIGMGMTYEKALKDASLKNSH